MRTFISAAIIAAAGTATAQIDTSYTQNFEGYNQASATTLGDDGWLGFANVFLADGTTFAYNYGVFPTPNGTGAFSNVATGEGGPTQGAQQLVVFNDYNNADHGNGSNNRIEANVFREWNIAASDVGTTVTFSFDAKRGDIAGASTAAAFIKILDPNAGFALTTFETVDTTAISTEWNRYSASTTIQANQVGSIFQIGFLNVASNFDASGVFYDNIALVPTPAGAALLGLGGLVAGRRRRA